VQVQSTAIHCILASLGIDVGIAALGWAEAPIKIARMTLTIKLDGNWSSFQLANNAPPLSVTGSVIAPSARMLTAVLLASIGASIRRDGLAREVLAPTLPRNSADARRVGQAWAPLSIVALAITRQTQKADSTLGCSQAVPHPSTNRALCRLTSEVRRDPVHSTRYGRRRCQ
jgi:hypothetical protein